MQRAKMQTEDGVQENIAKIKRLFPHCVTEARDSAGRLTYKIDKDLLLQELSGELIEEGEERYCLNWPGKKEALLTANKAIDKTLRPIDAFSERTPLVLTEEGQEAEYAEQEAAEQRSFEQASGGINFETTENVFIEGDNLDALKLLQETYLNKIKMIYIDPPYNTGRDFIYKDNTTVDKYEYLEDSEQIDEDGNYLVANPISNGRFHSDWLSFIYPRLKLARNLLRDDGVIFISIDDNEQANLKKLCDEIFGAENFIACLTWKKKYTGGKHAKGYVDLHEYILTFGKSVKLLQAIKIDRPDEEKQKFTEEDEFKQLRGKFYVRPLKSNLAYRRTLNYPIEAPDGSILETQWLVAKDRFYELLAEKRVEFRQKRDGTYQIYRKYYENDGGGSIKPPSLIEKFPNTEAKTELKNLFEVEEGRDNVFYTVKPVNLIKYIMMPYAERNDIILDFFAGSGTTAQAVMQLNAEDGGRRKFILVQLPEEVEAKSEAAKAGFWNIAEICKERIRRAGQMIKTGKYPDGRPVKDWKEPKNPDLDIGFRVFKIASSNMKGEYYCLPQNTDQTALTEKVDNVKKDRTDEDLLFQLFLEWGVPLSARIEKEEIDGKQVFFVNKAEYVQTDMIACFDHNLAESLLIKLAQMKPLRAVFRDHGFANDSMRENVDGIFKQIAPDTDLRVI